MSNIPLGPSNPGHPYILLEVHPRFDAFHERERVSFGTESCTHCRRELCAR